MFGSLACWLVCVFLNLLKEVSASLYSPNFSLSLNHFIIVVVMLLNGGYDEKKFFILTSETFQFCSHVSFGWSFELFSNVCYKMMV